MEIVIDQLKLQDAKLVCTRVTKEEGRTQEDNETPLEPKETSLYGAFVAWCNYLAPDRPDISYAVKELARPMAAPRTGDMHRRMRLGCYLKGRPRLQQEHCWQNAQLLMKTFSDADWAWCRETRKSTSDGCIREGGGGTIKSRSRTRSLNALSSGMSEVFAALKASGRNTRNVGNNERPGMPSTRGSVGRCECSPWDYQSSRARQDVPHRCGMPLDPASCCTTTSEI